MKTKILADFQIYISVPLTSKRFKMLPKCGVKSDSVQSVKSTESAQSVESIKSAKFIESVASDESLSASTESAF